LKRRALSARRDPIVLFHAGIVHVIISRWIGGRRLSTGEAVDTASATTALDSVRSVVCARRLKRPNENLTPTPERVSDLVRAVAHAFRLGHSDRHRRSATAAELFLLLVASCVLLAMFVLGVFVAVLLVTSH
jgi:hypothetical protein